MLKALRCISCIVLVLVIFIIIGTAVDKLLGVELQGTQEHVHNAVWMLCGAVVVWVTNWTLED